MHRHHCRPTRNFSRMLLNADQTQNCCRISLLLFYKVLKGTAAAAAALNKINTSNQVLSLSTRKYLQFCGSHLWAKLCTQIEIDLQNKWQTLYEQFWIHRMIKLQNKIFCLCMCLSNGNTKLNYCFMSIWIKMPVLWTFFRYCHCYCWIDVARELLVNELFSQIELSVMRILN